MDNIVKQTHNLLLKNKATLAVAESCTGGLLSNMLTSISGSSGYFTLGLTAYSNKAKSAVLKISPMLIAKKGAVSQKVALQMAQAVRKLSKTDFAIGITGIAGPGGGTYKKPVGTVFIAIDSVNKKLCRRFLFKGSRISIRKKAALKSLKLLKLLVTSY